MADTLLKTLSDIIRNGNLAKSVNNIKTQLVNNSSVPDYVKLIEREDVTEEEMARQAESYADSLYADEINKVKTDADKKLTELDTRLDKAISNHSEKMRELSDSYKNAQGKIERGAWHSIEVAPNDNAYITIDMMIQGFIQSRGGTNA